MAEAMLPPLVEATTATLRAETAAAQAGKGLAATVQPKKRNSGALRRGAQAAEGGAQERRRRLRGRYDR